MFPEKCLPLASRPLACQSLQIERDIPGRFSLAQPGARPLFSERSLCSWFARSAQGGGMLRILGPGAKLCDGVTRRKLMQVGALSLFGSVTLPRLLRAAETRGGAAHGRARSVIMFNLLGGPSHMDMFDLKPSAPAEIRGEFKPIATSVPGIQVCEHLPHLARLMHRACLIRTFTHSFNSHDPLPFLTGYTDLGFL